MERICLRFENPYKFCPTEQDFLVSVFLTPLKGLFAPTSHFPLPTSQSPNFLDFQNPWEKVGERRGLRF